MTEIRKYNFVPFAVFLKTLCAQPSIALASPIFSTQCLCKIYGKLHLQYSLDRLIFPSTYLEITHKQSVPQSRFSSYFQKGKVFPFGKESIFPFRKNRPTSEDTKFKLSPCMSLVFGASKNVSFSNDNHILKFFTEGFENLPSSFFSVLKICY